jgi:hypothetical protein
LISSALIKLARWNPSETLPAGLSSTSLQTAIDAQRLKMRPANDAEITSAVQALVTHAAATGITCGPMASVKAVWQAHCREMPAVLLASGLAKVLRGWTNTFCLPAPGAIWEAIEGDLSQFRRDLGQMERARGRTIFSDLDFPPEDLKPNSDTQKVLDETLALLKKKAREHGRIF